MGMTITYELGNALYVNFTNQCCNDCTFCLRNNHDDVNGKDNLWLDHEPSLAEIKNDFSLRDMSRYQNIVFCGFGEPLMRFDVCMETAKWLKETYPNIKIRINTNGLVNLIEKRDVTQDFKGLVDAVSISLNAPTAKQYDEICQSIFGEEAFYALLDFAKKVNEYVPDVVLSIVDKTLSDSDVEACKKLAKDCGVNIRIREFVD